jgi:hypothetical protein
MAMTKTEFRPLFLRALEGAAASTEAKLVKPAPRSFVIELHAPGSAGRTISVDETLDRIYLGSDRFYRVIDIAIKELLPGKSVAFVRVGGHAPVAFSQTWDPSGLGPFKQIPAEKIDDGRVRAG